MSRWCGKTFQIRALILFAVACSARLQAAPSITSLTPNSGTAGMTVTIAGSGFGALQGTGVVKFHGVVASVSSWSDTTIATAVPVGATTGTVQVTTGNGQLSNAVSFTIPVPAISTLYPVSGRAGTAVTITGTNFGQTGGTVTFNGTAATTSSWSDGQIIVTVPSGASTGAVVVAAGGNSNGVTFTVVPPPTITGLSPSSAPINTVVTVTGSGFGIPQGTGSITFNGTAALPTSWSDGSIVVPVPPGSGTGPVVVAAGGTNSNSVTFTVTGGPSISGLSPSSGPPGTLVTISGSNFGAVQGTSFVSFNGRPASVTSWSTNSIQATVPAGVSTGPVTVNISRQVSNALTFTTVMSGTLSGTVSNASSGTGIAGATVQARQNGAVEFSATTASDGTYLISGITAGAYDVQGSASSFGAGLTSPVSVTAGQTTVVNFSLSSPASASGRVTQSDGVTPLSGATVQAFVSNASAGSATTDAGGNYSIGGLNAGTYTLQASATGFVSKSQSINLVGGSSATANFALQLTGITPITYDYDELGRLVGVTDSSGDTAVYQYDAVGNILSISRYSSSQVSIVSFSPRTGTAGTVVTIQGTGFSTTASQNTVQFNGVAATVNSATTTQLSVAVPSAATTGPISVSTSSGSAVSSTNFTVGTPSGAPTITGFTPQMGKAGNSVTVTGTNFYPVESDKLSFNITRAVLASATATQVNTTVPASTSSGRISVFTPGGTATSSQDFFIPFGTYLVSDIGYSGRFSFGNSQTVSLAVNKIGLLIFDAIAGQSGSIQLSGSTFSNCSLTVFGPTGAQVTTSSCTSSTTNVGSIPFATTGTYTIGIAGGTSAGSITIGLTQDVVSSTSIDGTPVAVTTTLRGQDAWVSFGATAGQRVVVYVTNVSNPSATVRLMKPDGSILSSLSIANSPAGKTFYFDTQTLPVTGTYQLWVQHSASNVGSETLQVASVPSDFTATLTIPSPGQTGASVRAPTTGNLAVGQNATFTFSGTAGQKLSFNANSAIGSGTNDCAMNLYNPSNGSVWGVFCGNSPSLFADTTTLTTTGTYSILVNPLAMATGNVSISANNDADVSGAIVIDGSAVTTGNAVPGQDIRLSFSATAGQRIIVYATSVTTPLTYVYLVKPDGTNQASVTLNNNPSGQTFFMDTQALATTGTYQLWVQHYSKNIGNETLRIASVPADVSGSVTIGGSAFAVSTVAGQNANITFGNPQSQTLSVHWTAGTYVGSCYVRVTGPSPSTNQVGFSNCGGATGIANLGTQPAGTYNILIDPQAAISGGLSLTVTSP